MVNVTNNVESMVDESDFFIGHPNVIKNFIPGYNSFRRIKLQTFSDRELEMSGFDSEDINHTPLFDDMSILWDFGLLSAYLGIAYSVYQKFC